MKILSETTAIAKLADIRAGFADVIRRRYEVNAHPCSLCSDPGICCRDEHFVNVHISRLEAGAIRRALADLGREKEQQVLARVKEAVEKYDLEGSGESFAKTYACPLFEKDAGCLVHQTAKPLPCIAHACYEQKEELPPDGLLAEKELEIAGLNRRVYGAETPLIPLPAALNRR